MAFFGKLLDDAAKITKAVVDTTINTVNALDPLDVLPDATLDPLLNPEWENYDFSEYEGAKYLAKRVTRLPDCERFPVDKLIRMGAIGVKATASAILAPKKLKKNCDSISEFYDQFFINCEWFNLGEEFVGSLKKSELANSWDTDEAFAAQFVAGVNPMRIRRQTVYDTVAQEMHLEEKDRLEAVNKVVNYTTEGNLQNLVNAGKIFTADYPDIATAWSDTLTKIEAGEIKTASKNFGPAKFILYDARVMFYLKDDSHLMPLAIELVRPAGYSEQKEAKFYTPIPKGDDGWFVWLYAKMCVLNTDAQYHEMISHLNFTHLAMEPVIIAFHQALPKHHKVLELMKPFFEQTLAINQLGRRTLLAPGIVFDQILSLGLVASLTAMQLRYRGQADGLDQPKKSEHWGMFENSFPEDLKERGFPLSDDSKEDYPDIPGFYYRSDGEKVWNAYLRFMEICVNIYIYPSEEAFQGDGDIAKLKTLLSTDDNGAIPGVKMETREELIYLLTTILWTSSAQHSAVNFGQATFYSYIPGRPVCLFKWMPEDPKDVTTEFILSSLAGFLETIMTIQVAAVLSLPTSHPVSVELKLQKQIFDLKVNPTFDDPAGVLKQQLKNISEVINERNGSVPQPGFEKTTDFPPYEWLNPNQIPASIAI